jgi:hypothetical protein
MANAAEKGPKIAQIRSEMQEMRERRQRLQSGETELARMFDVLMGFKSSLGIDEEEDDEEFDL